MVNARKSPNAKHLWVRLKDMSFLPRIFFHVNATETDKDVISKQEQLAFNASERMPLEERRKPLQQV